MTKVEKTIDVGCCRANIFTSEIRTAEGEIPFRTVTVTRTFRGRDGSDKTAYSFRMNDIPKAVLALIKAYLFLLGGEGIRTPGSDEH